MQKLPILLLDTNRRGSFAAPPISAPPPGENFFFFPHPIQTSAPEADGKDGEEAVVAPLTHSSARLTLSAKD